MTSHHIDEKSIRSSSDINPNFVSQMQLFLSKPENVSPKIDYLITQYEIFKKQQQNSIETSQQIENYICKQAIFDNIEKILSEIVYIENKEIRQERIDALYEWFTKNSKRHNDLSQIKSISEAKIYQRLTEDELHVNDREYQEKIDLQIKERHGDESEHRTILYNYARPSMILKNEYRYKHITKKKSHSTTHREHSHMNIIPPPQQDNAPANTNENNINNDNQQQPQQQQQQQQPPQPSNISSTTITSQFKPVSISSFKDKERFRSSVGMKSTFYSTAKTSLNAFMNTTYTSFSQLSSTNLKPEDSLKEIKSSYSFMRPDYTFKHLNAEKYANNLKQQQLAEKRTQEELKHKLNEYGYKRSEFKSNNQKKYDYMEVINIYLNRLKAQEEQKSNNDNEQEVTKLKEYFNKQKRLKHSLSSVNINVLSSRDKDNDDVFLRNYPIKKRKGTTISNFDDDDNNDDSNKVFVNNIRNINSDLIINPNTNEQFFHFKINIKQHEEKDNICKAKIEEEDGDGDELLLQTDLLNNARQNDKKLNIRLLHSKMNSFSLNAKLKETYYDNPLSAYSLVNYKSFYNKQSLYENNKQKYTNVNNNSCSYIKNNFDYNDYLKMRHSLSNFNKIQAKKLQSSQSCSSMKRNTMLSESDVHKDKDNCRNRRKSTEQKNEDNSLNYNSVSFNLKNIENAFVMPDVRTFYPKYFLPRSSSGLLKMPADMLKGLKKKDKKKKK